MRFRTQVWKFSVLTGKLQPTNTPILHLTFGYHQLGINRPILDSLETVWDRAVSLHSSCAVCRRLSHLGPDVSTGTMYQSLVATLSLVYMAPSAALRIWQQLACFLPLSPSLLLHPLTFYLKGLACVCVGWVGGDIVTKAKVRLWKARGFRGPIKTQGSALLRAD